MILLSGCKNNVNDDYDSLDDYFLAKANEVIIKDNQISFYDDSGRDELITLTKGYDNVMSLYASYTTLWYESGGVVNSTIGGNNAISLYETYIGRNIIDTDGVLVVANNSAGSNFNLEKIFSLEPDLIIASNAMNGYNSISEAIISAGIPIIAIDYNNFADYLKWFKVFSFLNDQEKLYDEVALKSLSEIKNIIATMPDVNNKVLAIFPSSSYPTGATNNTLIGEMLKELKQTNIIDNELTDKVVLNLEDIYLKQPDIILVICHNTEEEAKQVLENTIFKNPIYNELEAVKNNGVIYLPKELFHNKPNSKFVLAYETLAQILKGE